MNVVFNDFSDYFQIVIGCKDSCRGHFYNFVRLFQMPGNEMSDCEKIF